ncbi:MAG: hypothetical protein HKO66_11415 [Saprospiraceae bacterium]|nr:hypothetical protein [Bacteroidia bacterium]NNE16777.1 hypothetical protein [Saprospiraceae bacterium]NNL92835.1 hypothetical protein [Saprospiraceae bacterium]
MKKLNTYIAVICVLFISQVGFGQAFNNNISIRYNLSAADGVGQTPGRDILFNRFLNESLAVRIGYSQGMKSTKWQETLFSRQPNLLDEFISSDNTKEDVTVEYFQYHSINLGVYFVSNTYGKSDLSLYAGGRYLSSHKMFIQSFGSKIEAIDELNRFRRELGYELEIAYNYHPIDRMTISLGVNYVSNLSLFGASFGMGFSF